MGKDLFDYKDYVDKFAEQAFQAEKHLFVPQDVLQVEHLDHYIQHGNKKKSLRKIYYNQPFCDFEWAQLDKLKAAIKESGIKVPDDLDNDQELMKFVYSGKCTDVKTSMKYIQQHIQWRSQEQWHRLSEECREEIVYERRVLPIRERQTVQTNRDHRLRQGEPQAQKLYLFEQILCYVCSSVIQNTFHKGKVENWLFLIDINGKGLFNFPFKVLGRLIEITQINFRGTLHKLFILNPSFSLNASWSVIKQMMDPDSLAKINILNKKAMGQMLEFIDTEQLQVRFGGTLPNIPDNQYYPFRNTISHLQPLQESPENIVTEEPNKQLIMKNEEMSVSQKSVSQLSEQQKSEQISVSLKSVQQKSEQIRSPHDNHQFSQTEVQSTNDIGEMAKNTINRQYPYKFIQYLQQKNSQVLQKQ